MIPVLILLAVCAVTRADRYADYAGVSMPHYSMEEGSHDAASRSEDYSERSPDADAPVSFDYKSEEELREKEHKIPMKTEEENWHAQRLEDPLASDDDEPETHEHESLLKSRKGNRKYGRHRTRIKNKLIDRDEPNYRPSNLRSRQINGGAIDIRNYNTIKGRSREDNSIESDSDNVRGTEKVIRRKPRDRRVNFRRLDVDYEDYGEDLKSSENNDMKPLRRDEANAFVKNKHVQNRRANSQTFMFERAPHPENPVPENTRMGNKKYPVYDDDYYDMRRVNQLKNKLPDLHRKTQARVTETPRIRPVQQFSNRRADLPRTTAPTAKTSNTIRTESTTFTEAAFSSVTNSTGLSLAEKSRLSILKKAQRKDDVKNVTWTTKPPVLMQVTRRMQTMVMVEPPHSDVRLRAREVFYDTPERIGRAKKLMRKKLMEGARSINDLTDHWDEMVCDYIDVSLLDCSSSAYPTLGTLFLSLLSLKWSYILI